MYQPAVGIGVLGWNPGLYSAANMGMDASATFCGGAMLTQTDLSTNQGTIFSKGDQANPADGFYELGFAGSGALYASVSAGGVIKTATAGASFGNTIFDYQKTWTAFFTVTGGNINLYVNGYLATTTALGASVDTFKSGAVFSVGCRNATNLFIVNPIIGIVGAEGSVPASPLFISGWDANCRTSADVAPFSGITHRWSARTIAGIPSKATWTDTVSGDALSRTSNTTYTFAAKLTWGPT